MRIALTLTLAAALAACGRPDPIARGEADAASLPEPANNAIASPTGGPPPKGAVPANGVTAAAAAIPSALQGRWGLTPGDCTSNRGDAKGLLVVEADRLRFYESRAVPAGDVETSPDSISGNFSFTGEGQEWTKFLALERQEDKLVRTERDPNASFTYARC